MADEKKKKKPFWQNLFSKELAMEEAQSYAELSFFKKSKNGLIAFFLFVCAISIGLASLGAIEDFPLVEVAIGTVIYLVWLPFIYFNHRWAIVIPCLIYAVDKVFLIAQGLGTPVQHIIFLVLAISLTYRAFMAATYLKEIRKTAVNPSTFS